MSFEESHTDSHVAGDPAPTPHATAEQVEAARHDSKLAQVLYHDWEASTYDAPQADTMLGAAKKVVELAG